MQLLAISEQQYDLPAWQLRMINDVSSWEVFFGVEVLITDRIRGSAEDSFERKVKRNSQIAGEEKPPKLSLVRGFCVWKT